MPINIDKMYKNCSMTPGFTQEDQDLLDKMLTISTPMDFNDDFASNEDLDRLEKLLDNSDIINADVLKFKKIIIDLKARQALKSVFI
jgi:hypothetical protein